MPCAPSFTGTPTNTALDPVFALQACRARQHLLLVLQNRLHHLHRRRRRSVVSASGLQILHDLGAAVARALHQPVDGGLVQQLRSAECPKHWSGARDGTMVSPCPPSTSAVTFSTETFSSCAMNVRKRAVSRTPAMPITRVLGEFRDLKRGPAHGVQRIRHQDQDRVAAKPSRPVRWRSSPLRSWRAANRRGSCRACAENRP